MENVGSLKIILTNNFLISTVLNRLMKLLHNKHF